MPFLSVHSKKNAFLRNENSNILHLSAMKHSPNQVLTQAPLVAARGAREGSALVRVNETHRSRQKVFKSPNVLPVSTVNNKVHIFKTDMKSRN